MLALNIYARHHIRKNIIKAGYAGKHAHFSGSLSCTGILTFLRPADASFHRKRNSLSKGHCALALNVAEAGFIAEEPLLSMNSNAGDFPRIICGTRSSA